MTEFMSASSGLFERLEQSMVDPHVKEKMELARFYEEVLNESEDKDELLNYVADLDKGWAFMNATLKVTGKMWQGEPGMPVMHLSRVERTVVISHGFSFDADKIIFDEEYLVGHRHASLQFLIEGENGDRNTVGTMRLEDIDDIEYPFASNELRIQRLPINYPELAEDIDELIMNADSDNDKINRLRVFTLEVDFSDPEQAVKLEDAQAYIDKTILLDRELPIYYLQVLGKIGLMKDEHGIVVLEVERQFKRLVTVNRVSLHPDDLYETAESKHTFMPCLDVTVHGKKAGDSAQDAIIPFTSIISAESIRMAP